MPRINYIAEIRAFAAFASRSRLTANEFVLWHALLEMFNQESCGAHWPDGWLPVANARLLAQTTFGAGDSACDRMRRAREGLQRHGLIRYKPGRKGSLMPRYCLNYLSVEPASRAPTAPCETNPPAANPAPGTQASPPAIAETNPAASASHRVPNPDGNGTQNQGHTQPVPGGTRGRPPAFDEGWRTSARARGAVAQRLLDAYGGIIDTTDAWGGLCEVMEGGLSPEVILGVMPTRPRFSLLIARLRALALALSLPSKPARGPGGDARPGPAADKAVDSA